MAHGLDRGLGVCAIVKVQAPACLLSPSRGPHTRDLLAGPWRRPLAGQPAACSLQGGGRGLRRAGGPRSEPRGRDAADRTPDWAEPRHAAVCDRARSMATVRSQESCSVEVGLTSTEGSKAGCPFPRRAAAVRLDHARRARPRGGRPSLLPVPGLACRHLSAGELRTTPFLPSLARLAAPPEAGGAALFRPPLKLGAMPLGDVMPSSTSRLASRNWRRRLCLRRQGGHRGRRATPLVLEWPPQDTRPLRACGRAAAASARPSTRAVGEQAGPCSDSSRPGSSRTSC